MVQQSTYASKCQQQIHNHDKLNWNSHLYRKKYEAKTSLCQPTHKSKHYNYIYINKYEIPGLHQYLISRFWGWPMIHSLWLEYFLVRGIRRIANVLCICCTNFVLNFWGETCLVQEISFSFRFHMVETSMTYYKCKLIYIVLKYLTDESNFECISYPKYNMYYNSARWLELKSSIQ